MYLAGINRIHLFNWNGKKGNCVELINKNFVSLLQFTERIIEMPCIKTNLQGINPLPYLVYRHCQNCFSLVKHTLAKGCCIAKNYFIQR